MSGTIERDLGRLESRLVALEADVSTMAADLREIRRALHTIRGGWIALGVVVAASSGLGAIIAKLWPVIGRP